MEKVDYNKISNFLFELGMLKNVKRSGWWVAGVKDPESVAEHSLRAAQLAYIIAKLEGADARKAACICLMHDVPEARINDQHKVAARYIDSKKAEHSAIEEQVILLPESIGSEIKSMFSEFMDCSTKEGIIAKDSDYLECAIQAKEYLDIGHKSAQGWINNVEQKLKTDTAKKIFKIISKKDSKLWFQDLKNLE
jgi:putative hydrolase of HD superfamily